MLISFKNKTVLSFFMLLLIILVSCSGESKKKLEVSDTDSLSTEIQWKTYTYKNLVFHYPAVHLYADSIHGFAKSSVAIIRNDCQFLQIAIPSDTLNIFLYPNPDIAKEMTGQEYPFVSGDTLHHWQFYNFGTTMMMYLVDKWSAVESKHQFIYHGLLKLLDASGRDFHERTFLYIDSSMFIPLHQLAVTDEINASKEWHQSGEAASFVDFITYRYGIKALKMMYESPLPFDSTVNGMFKMSVDSLEATWLDVVGKATGYRK